MLAPSASRLRGRAQVGHAAAEDEEIDPKLAH